MYSTAMKLNTNSLHGNLVHNATLPEATLQAPEPCCQQSPPQPQTILMQIHAYHQAYYGRQYC
jgi:hypothetical protein